MKIEHTGPDWTTVKIRQSDINTFDMCPEQLREKMTGALPDTTSDAALIGTAMHAGIQAVLGHDATRTKATDIVAWSAEQSATSGMDLDEVVDTAIGCFDVWYEAIYPAVTEPLYIEQPFDLHAYDMVVRGRMVSVRLTGTIDCITRDGAVWDWKSTGSLRSFQQWEKDRFATQPTVYLWAAATLGIAPLDGALFHYGVVARNKLPSDADAAKVMTVRRDVRHYAWLRDKVRPMVELALADLPEWPRNDQGWHCSGKWCPVWQAGRCKGAHAADDPTGGGKVWHLE